MEQLSGQDAMFIHAEIKGLPQHIGGVTIYNPATAENGIVRFKQILAMLRSRVHLSPIFRRKLAPVPLGLGQPYWTEDPNFDLEYHVRHIALPQPGDWRQLCIQAARIHAIPLARDKPLWEMYIIEGLDNVEGIPPGCFALLLKVHHSAMDGPTGAHFMSLMHDMTPVVEEPPEAPPWIIEQPSTLAMLTRAYLDALRTPGRAVRMLRDAVPTYRRLRRGYAEKKFEKTGDIPRTRFQGKVSPHRVVDARTFDFATVRELKNAVAGATINDAMLAIVSGAMRLYLEQKNELPSQSLVTGCPIDVRSPEERATGGNMVGFMSVSLCSDIKDPAKRLAAIQRKSTEAKAYAEALGPRIAVDITDLLPGGVLAVAVRTAAITGLSESNVMANTVVTNVPGAPYSQYLCGAELIKSFSLGPLLPNIGLFHIVYSSVQKKQGAITLSFTACREMLPDPEVYAQCLQDSFDEMCQSLLTKGQGQSTGKGKASTAKKKAAAKKPAAKARSKGPAKASARTST
ncbi:wax ester/triacylglycerol synthase family O-acyltransferase [Parahaliea sp. F7430]|uniref:diacylglycerol O-acyltransferase n=1 Tax=Sediminihaliea albiluteola TaxID=2758564 RepID=A0A7W2YJ09_9GAMM|nr:wax ester/triacylglycerol synthase family O-acyltransferase [Sediminihaliea albiluteola]MBA6412655.1 wax ester/triacylglycerol synthase family O-acyltransferase [Sediminihaliea albiluteola]